MTSNHRCISAESPVGRCHSSGVHPHRIAAVLVPVLAAAAVVGAAAAAAVSFSTSSFRISFLFPSVSALNRNKKFKKIKNKKKIK